MSTIAAMFDSIIFQQAQTCSFDVFDTCITRTFANPKDLFYELGLRLAPVGHGDQERHKFAARFQSLRIRAESKAHRIVRPHETVTVHNIYEQLDLPRGLTIQIRDLIQAEIALERESIYPIPVVVSWIRHLRRVGKRIIFISDMYLPSSVLAPILMNCGVMEKEDGLYVSCDVGASKHHGQLFQHVLKAEGLDASQLIHSGDNLHADVRMASSANIKARHISDGMLSTRESRMAGSRLPRSPACSFLAGLAKRLRLSETDGADNVSDPLDYVRHGVVIPFLLAYVIWVMDAAQAHGIRRLYFVARDGEVMYRIAKALQGEGDDPELRYLYGSRRAWLPASITPDSDEWTKALILPGPSNIPNTRYDILSRTGLTDKENEVMRKRFGLSAQDWKAPINWDMAMEFVSEVAKREGVAFYSSSVRKDSTALAYLRQEGLFDPIRWAFVDTGWELNAQAAVGRILELGGQAHEKPIGFYIGLSPRRLDQRISGVAYPFVQEDKSIFFRRRAVVENCFTPSTHTTTHAYQRDIAHVKPMFGAEVRKHHELEYANRLHAAAYSAARLIAVDPRMRDMIRKYTPQIIDNAAYFLLHPNPGDVRRLASFGIAPDTRHDAEFVHNMCTELAASDMWNILKSSLPLHVDSTTALPVWVEGSTAISPWYSRMPMTVLQSGMLVRDWLRRKRSAAT